MLPSLSNKNVTKQDSFLLTVFLSLFHFWHMFSFSFIFSFFQTCFLFHVVLHFSFQCSCLHVSRFSISPPPLFFAFGHLDPVGAPPLPGTKNRFSVTFFCFRFAPPPIQRVSGLESKPQKESVKNGVRMFLHACRYR